VNLGFTPEPPDACEQAGTDQARSIGDGSFLENVTIGDDTTIAPNARKVAFHGVRVVGKALARTTLPGLGLTDCVLDRADVSSGTWTDARLVRVMFDGCKLTGLDARGADLRDVVFRDCKAPECLLSESAITRVVFENCRVTDLDLSGARITSMRFRGCDLRNLRLTGAKIGLLDLRGCEISGIAIDPGAMGGIVIETTQSPAIAAAVGVRVIDEL